MRNNKNFGLTPDLVDAVRSVLSGKPVEEGGMKRGKDLDTFKPKIDEKLSLKDFKVGMFIQGKGGKVGKIISNQPRGELINVQWNKGGREEMQIKGLGLYTKPRLQGLVREDRDKEEDELDPVNPKAVKKKFKDREDKDIDNDGDTDSSDKFLHKKRKAISKAIAKDDEDDVEESFKTFGVYLRNEEDVEVEESIGNVKVNPRKPSPFPTKGVTVSKYKIKGKSMPPVPAGGKLKKEEDEPEDDDNGEDKPKTKKKANGNGKKDEIDMEPALDEYITKEGDRKKVNGGDGRRTEVDEAEASRSQDKQKGETKPVKQGTPKAHDCAQKVVHEQWGLGSCLPQMHAIPDEEGTIAWYDVVFNHGVEREVDITELKVVSSGVHSH